jgi:hypothetical protein
MVDYQHSTQFRDWLYPSKEHFRDKVKKAQKNIISKIDKYAGGGGV